MDYVQNMTVHSLTSNRSRLEIGLFSLSICIDSFQRAFCITYFTKCYVNEYQAGKLHYEIETNGKTLQPRHYFWLLLTDLLLPVCVGMCKMKGYSFC